MIGPLSAGDIDTLMQDCGLPHGDARLALAVSGGPDSMAMAYAVHDWCERHQHPAPLAFIVDHGLRAESAREAETVKNRLHALGISAEILRWEHAPITSRLHSEARKARYGLLLDACQRHSLATLLFAHQREDQAETILMRLSKGTGLDGLAGIPARHAMRGIQIRRPFLTVPKTRLIATCQAARISFVTDPSNGLEKFARGRMRRVLPLLAEDGLTIDRLIDFGTRAAEARDALAHYTHAFLKQNSAMDTFGVITVDKAALLTVPHATALRALGMALQTIHTEDYTPAHSSLTRILDTLHAEETMPSCTLNGCLVGVRKNQVAIAREASGIHQVITVKAGETVIWDGRWQVTLGPQAGEPHQVKALGNQPHEILDQLASGLRHKVPQGRVRASLPALWSGGVVKIIPFLHQNDQAQAKLLSLWPPDGSN